MIVEPYSEEISEYKLETTEDIKAVLEECAFIESVLAGFVHGPVERWPELSQHTVTKIAEYTHLTLPKDHICFKAKEMYGPVISSTVDFVANTAKQNMHSDQKLDLWQILCLSHQYLLSQVFLRFSISYFLKFVPETEHEYFYMNYFRNVWREYSVECKELKRMRKHNLKKLKTVNEASEVSRLKKITDSEFLKFPWALALNLEPARKPF